MDDFIGGLFAVMFYIMAAITVVVVVLYVVAAIVGATLLVVLPTYLLVATAYYFLGAERDIWVALGVARMRLTPILWFAIPASVWIGILLYDGQDGLVETVLWAYNIAAWLPVAVYVAYQIGYAIYLVGLRIARWLHYRRLPDFTIEHLVASGQLDLAAIERDAPLAILAEIPTWWKSQNIERRAQEALQYLRGQSGSVVSRIDPRQWRNRKARDVDAAAVALETYAEYQREAGEREIERRVEEARRQRNAQ